MTHKIRMSATDPSTSQMFVKHESALEIFKIYLRSVIISDTEIIMTSAVIITAPCTCHLLSVLVPKH